MPQGYRTKLIDARMSGGEIQRIGLARTFARAGRVLVLVGVLRKRRGLLVRLYGWSVAMAVPAFLSGHLVAAALDDGFLAGRPRPVSAG